jgi:hypothetical protein
MRLIGFILVLAFAGLTRLSAFTTCIMSNVVTAKVRGTVLFKHQEREWTVPAAKVELLTWNATDLQIATVNADSNGEFEISGIKAGRYRIKISSAGLLSAEAELRVAPHRLIVLPQNRRRLVVSLGLVLGPCPEVRSTSDVPARSR